MARLLLEFVEVFIDSFEDSSPSREMDRCIFLLLLYISTALAVGPLIDFSFTSWISLKVDFE